MKNRRLTYWTILLNPVFIVVCALGLHFLYQLCQYGGTAAERALGAWLRPGRPGMDSFLDGSLFSQEEEIFRG